MNSNTRTAMCGMFFSREQSNSDVWNVFSRDASACVNQQRFLLKRTRKCLEETWKHFHIIMLVGTQVLKSTNVILRTLEGKKK